ncbi:MAG TPA: ABC transporter permease [Candidatus Acidoferrum sp.]
MNFHWLSRRKRVEELNQELESHVTMAAKDLVARSALKTAAAHAARHELGNFSLVREVTQDAWGGRWWRDLLEDSRHGLRILRKNPGFTAVAVLTLALGIGANTAIFTVLNSAVLKSLPVAHPEELVVLTDPDAHGSQFGSQTGDRSLLAYSEFEYLRDHNDFFSGIFAADSSLPDVEVNLGDSSAGSGGKKETNRVKLVSGDYFATLGVTPAAGRMFRTEVDRARGGSPIAVVSYVFWKQRFGLNPSMLGKTIHIRHASFEIVGVAPPEFFGETVGEAPDIWIPMMMQEAVYPGRDLLSPSPQGITNQHLWIQVMARLKPETSFAQAKTRINVVFKRMLESAAGAAMTAAEPRNYLDQRLNVQPGARGASTLRADFGTPLAFLMVLVGLVLLIACANVANLVLARGAARQKEFAMRIAIGAGRTRLIRQLLAESLLLALLGAFAGVLLAYWADTLLLHMVSQAATRPGAIQLHLIPDLRVLGFTLGVTALTTILFGLIPSLHVTRPNLSPVLKSASVGVTGEPVERQLPLGKMLVVIQVAISLVLLVAAGLFVHSLSKLSQVNLGYNRENLLLFQVNATAGGYKGPAATRMYQQLLERISAIPGLRGATVSHNGLFSHSESGDPIAVEGYTPKPNEEMDSRIDHVGPGYFSTMGIPILMGREIGLQDSSAGVRGGVINETFARRFFPNVNPIGKHIRDTYPGNPADMGVVGVAADAKYNSLREETPPRVYAPLFNPMWEQAAAIYEVRTFADPSSVSVSLRKAVEETSASLPAIEIHTMSGLVDDSLETDRFIEKLAGALGILAMLLASIGLYGIMAYTVACRTRDIGIRLALGAEKENVLWQVLRETLALVLIGTAIGVPLAMGATHLVKSMLFGLGFADPIAILFAAAVLALVAAVAGLLPAWRASQVNPMVALRHE